MRVGEQSHAPAVLPLGKEIGYPLYRSLGLPPGPVWTGAEKLASTGIRSLDRPARSETVQYFHRVYLCVVYGSQNTQRPLPYAALTDCFFYNRDGNVLTAR